MAVRLEASLPCRKEDLNLFFPPVESDFGETPTPAEQAALAVCQGCPVLAGCRRGCLELDLRVALSTGMSPWGVCGGMTGAQRRVAVRNRDQVAA